MTQQIINVGSGELAGDGESIRSAFVKTNANFTELYTGLVGPTGPAGLTGPTGPIGPGADQALNTTSNVTFNSLNLSANATLSANGKLIFNSTESVSNIELWNNSSIIKDASFLRFVRSRGGLGLQSQQQIGGIQFDGVQPLNGYSSDYQGNLVFPGFRALADSTWNANSAGTRLQFLNRVSYNPTLPYPFNTPNSQTTDSTVISSLEIRPVSITQHGSTFRIEDPYQGFNNVAGTSTAITSGLFGINRLTSLSGGNLIELRNNFAAAEPGVPSVILMKSRTDHIPYWETFMGGLNTSTQGQINWIADNIINATKNDNRQNSIVKGANFVLNATRYQKLDKTVTYFASGGEPDSYSGNLLWNTSTVAGDVLGSISFQGGLSGVSDVNQLDGGVDGVVIRVYAKNDWQGDQNSTTTSVTYTNNQSVLRFEISTSTTIGPLDLIGGLQQKYKNVFEIDVSTATFNTDLFVRNGLQFLDGSIQTTGFDFSTSATAPSLMPGRLWFNSVEGRLYINYNNTWVEASPTQIDPSAIRYNNLNQIELPPGGDIVDSDGNSVLGGGGPGLGTYSFDGSILQSDEALIRTNDSDLTLESDSDVFVKSSAGGNTWQFGIDGSLTFPGNGKLNVKSTAPTHSYGVTGDKAGMIAFDGDFFYYCKQDYVNNTTDIWVRVVWTSSNW